MSASRSFASDNNAGIHPAILKAIADANQGHVLAYGEDPYTERAIAAFRARLGAETEVFFVFNGTGANVLGLQSLARPYHAVLCAESSHIHLDECGAPERFAGCKLVTVPTEDGKLTPQAIAPRIRGIGNQHHVQPRIISVSQTTEYGTVYSADELRALAELAHRNGLFLHVDGARISNAAASLGLSLKAITKDAGVDVLSFGGTKNGLLGGEAVVFLDPVLARDFKFIRKQGMQLASKMRFISAQFERLLAGDLWLENASRANAMASELERGLRRIPGITITRPVQANAVFALLPHKIIEAVRRKYHFHLWDEGTGEARLMASFDTEREDVLGLVAAIREEMGN